MLDDRVTNFALGDEIADAGKTVRSRVYAFAEDARDWKVGAILAHLVAAARACMADSNVWMVNTEAIDVRWLLFEALHFDTAQVALVGVGAARNNGAFVGFEAISAKWAVAVIAEFSGANARVGEAVRARRTLVIKHGS